VRLPSATSHRPPTPAPEWTPAIGEAQASVLGIWLTPRHWQVIACAREECLRTHQFPGPCAIAEASGMSRSDVERLFPGEACKVIAAIAGLVRADECEGAE
jgi:sulfur relay (sulfurtransferase) DsrC/TusE family protein